ncbi:hypothetical protein [Haloterrigena gelatinilytica]|nr:hypothetical protein [Haloterrigena gelatinilytica]
MPGEESLEREREEDAADEERARRRIEAVLVSVLGAEMQKRTAE